MGARWIGEIGITGVAAANAAGRRVRDLPITPEVPVSSSFPDCQHLRCHPEELAEGAR